MKTYVAKPNEVEKKWYLIDAEGKTLGHLAVTIADILRGKNKPEFTPHVDCGDFVVVINAGKLVLSGNKETDKLYYRHSKYPGGFKKESVAQLREHHPELIIQKAVKGMLPHNKLNSRIITKLKVYLGAEHPHQAQQVQVYPYMEKIK